MDLLLLLLPVTMLLALVVILAVLAERSLRHQRNSKLKRGHEESNAAGRMQEKHLL